jgi:hypothetical protein
VPRLLVAGVDSLYLSARAADVSKNFGSLVELRAQAAATESPVEWGEVDGHAFDVMPFARYGYRVLLESAEMSVYVTDASNRPTVRIELRSHHIQTVGVDRAWRDAVDVASHVAGARLHEVTVARLDLFADFADWILWRSDWAGLVSRAKVRAIGEPEPGQVETYQVGITPLLVRLYRKDIEVRNKGGFAPVFWDEYPGPVTRIEVQASPEHLRKYRFGSVEETLASCGDVWRHANGEFLRLCDPSEGPSSMWATRNDWRAVQRVGFERFPHSGVVPEALWAGDRERIRRLMYGCVISLAALDGIRDLSVALGLLPEEFRSLSQEKEFGREVARRHRRQTRWARKRAVDSAAASAGAGA